MYLGAVDRNKGVVRQNHKLQEVARREENFARWMEHPTSSIVHHEKACCEEARLWFLAYARSMESSALSRYRSKPPHWLSQLFQWGPSEWPISWCQLVNENVIDCGVFAALAREIFKAQGIDAHPAQVLLMYNETCTGHWKELWKSGTQAKKGDKKKGPKNEQFFFPWIGNELVYHEVCVVETAGRARIYDSTWGNWLESEHRVGYGSLLAIRTECPRILKWNNKTIGCGEWTSL